MGVWIPHYTRLKSWLLLALALAQLLCKRQLLFQRQLLWKRLAECWVLLQEILKNQENTELVKEFWCWRKNLYNGLTARKETLIELLDALWSNKIAHSVVELSENPWFRRDYHSLYHGIQEFLPHENDDNYSQQINYLCWGNFSNNTKASFPTFWLIWNWYNSLPTSILSNHYRQNFDPLSESDSRKQTHEYWPFLFSSLGFTRTNSHR